MQEESKIKRTRLLIVLVIIIAVFALAGIEARNLQKTGNAEQEEPREAVEIEQPPTDQITIQTETNSINSEELIITTSIEDETADICQEYTCIGTIELETELGFIPLEGKEINIIASEEGKFSLPSELFLGTNYRLRIDVLDSRVKIISRFYSELIEAN